MSEKFFGGAATSAPDVKKLRPPSSFRFRLSFLTPATTILTSPSLSQFTMSTWRTGLEDFEKELAQSKTKESKNKRERSRSRDREHRHHHRSKVCNLF